MPDSALTVKGFVNAAPVEVRDELRRIAPYLEMWVLMKDGGDHTRIRTFMNLGFNANVIHGLRVLIQQSTDELLDRVVNQGYRDIIRDIGIYGRLPGFSFLLPAYVLSNLLGVHKEDRGKVVQWSVDFVDFFNVVPISVETSQRLTRSGFAMIDYTKNLLAERRAHPRDDFLGTLVNAATIKGGFTDDEIVSNAMLLLLAGHVAVRNLVGNTVYLLLTHPRGFAKLKAGQRRHVKPAAPLCSPASKGQRQSDGSAIAGIAVSLNLFTFVQCQPRQAAEQCFKGNLRFFSSQQSPETTMGAMAKAQVLARLSKNVEAFAA